MRSKAITRLHLDRHRPSGRTRGPASPQYATTPLGDDRFQELIRSASAFFAEAERDALAERAQVIADIHRPMTNHDLTLDDLTDQPSCGYGSAKPD